MLPSCCITGRVYTLVRAEDLRHFRALLRKIDGSAPSSHKIDKEALERVQPSAEAALACVLAIED
jgi:hypothetical protein